MNKILIRILSLITSIILMTCEEREEDTQQMIVFDSNRDGNGEIYIMNANGDNQTNLTNTSFDEWNPQFSPNGSQLVYNATINDNWDLYIMDVDGNNVKRLTTHIEDDYFGCFSPDGSMLYFTSDHNRLYLGNFNLFSVDTDGENVTQITQYESWIQSPRISPDGSQIVFDYLGVNYSSTIYSLDMTTNDTTNLTYDFIGQNYVCSFNKGGTYIYFVSNVNGQYDIYRMRSDGSNKINLTNNPDSWDSFVQLSQDETKILYHSLSDNDYIKIMDVDGTNQTALMSSGGHDQDQQFSPAGSQIVFWSDRDGDGEIYIMDIDGSNLLQLTNNNFGDGSPQFQPIP